MTTNATNEHVPEITLGWRLQIALAHAGMGHQQMADILGVSRSTISRWLHDEGARPRAAFLKQWALACGVPFEWLDSDTPRTGVWFPRLVEVELAA